MLITIPDKARRRQEAIFELIKTEETFLNSVQLIVKEWFAQLQPLLDQKECDVIFANIEDIILWSAVSTHILNQLLRSEGLFIRPFTPIWSPVKRIVAFTSIGSVTLLSNTRQTSMCIDRTA